MCGRTSLAVDPATMATRFGVDVPSDTSPRYNIAPGEELLTVRNTDPETVTSLTWGLVPNWADDPADGPAPIIARRRLTVWNPRERRYPRALPPLHPGVLNKASK